jgi:ABC-type antimicrobial peptide transport system permease subunit
MNYNNGESASLLPPFAMREALLNESPSVETIANVGFKLSDKYKIGDNWFETGDLHYTEPSFFKIFDFGLKLGNEESSLVEPHSIILSSVLAKKYFGDQSPIGEIIEFEENGIFKITGVLNPIPSNSHLQFDMLMSANFNEAPYSNYKDRWSLGYGQNYILLKENYSPDQLAEDAKAILIRNKNKSFAEGLSVNLFGDLYLDGKTYGYETKMFGGQRRYIVIFSLVGGLILLVACFNYVNLYTARTFARTKDLAIRKVIGANRIRLLSLLVGETAFIALISLIVAVIAVELSLDSVNSLLNKRLEFGLFSNPALLFIPGAALLLVVLISGVYPAIVASSFNISNLLKGIFPYSKTSTLRKALLVFQFLICAGLLMSALAVRSQAKYMINLDLGYNVENIHYIDLYKGGFGGKYEQLKTELERIPQILDVSGASMPTRGLGFSFPLKKNGEQVLIDFTKGAADIDFTDLLEIEILQGRSFNELETSELKKAILINETGYKELGVDDPIGMELAGMYKIVGVMKDFHFADAKSQISPLLISTSKPEIPNLHFKFKEGERATVMLAVKNVWESFNTGTPFETTELATFYASAYQQEGTLVRIFNSLTAMLVVIAFLGLFALSSFEGQLREKELGIRKVLGANYLQLMKALSQRFVMLVVLALLLAIPVCYYLINNWLSSFPYRITDLTPQFSIAIVAVIFLTISILGVHGYLSSRKNPVDVLRNE